VVSSLDPDTIPLVFSPLTLWFPPLLLSVLGGVLLAAWVRRYERGRLGVIVAGVYLAHLVLAWALFVTSYAELPVFRELQVSGGFWRFAPDADGYHFRAIQLLTALRDDSALPAWQPTTAYEVLVAGLYALFGPFPLTPIVVNCGLAAATCLLAHRLTASLGGPPTACDASAVVVGLWPSTFAWSSQLLRDHLALFLTFAAVFASANVLRASTPTFKRMLALFAVAAAATTVRTYVGWILLAAAMVTVVAAAARLVAPVAVGKLLAVAACLLVAAVLGTGGLLANFYRNVEAADALVSPSPSLEGSGHREPDRPSRITIIPRLFEQKRRELMVGASSVIGPDADLSTWTGLVRFLPQAVLTTFLGPFPWDWQLGSSTGVFKVLAAIEALALAGLFPVMLVGTARALRAKRVDAFFVVAYSVAMLLFVGLLMSNLGGLVRLRSQALLPLLTLASAGGGMSLYVGTVRMVRDRFVSQAA
jgi:hypothetical protein